MMPMGLGPFVKEARLRNGWTQAELGERIGVDRAYLAQIETGKIRWPRDLVPDLADALGLSQVDMAIAAGLIDPPRDKRPSPPPDDPVIRQIVERLSALSDRERSHVLDVLSFLEGGAHGDSARRLTTPRAEPGTVTGQERGVRRTG